MTTIASIDAGTVRHRFNYDWAMNPDNGVEQDTYWWYASSVRLDPNEIWAEDEDGTLWVVPFTTDGEDEVTFGEPVKARLTAVPVAASAGVAATATAERRAQRVLAEGLERPDKPAREGETTAAEARPEPEEGVMDENVRAYLEAQGIDPEAATEEQKNAANVFVAAGWTPPAAEPEAVVEPVVEPEPVAAAAAPVIPKGMKLVPDETIASMQNLVKKDHERDRSETIDGAVSAGVFPPSHAEDWGKRYDIDPEGTKQIIASMPKGLVPVTERGTSVEPDAEQVSAGEMDAIRASFGIATTQKGA